jgi:hypothetical protein
MKEQQVRILRILRGGWIQNTRQLLNLFPHIRAFCLHHSFPYIVMDGLILHYIPAIGDSTAVNAGSATHPTVYPLSLLLQRP